VANLNLKAARRDILGKKSRFLRRQGVTPAHIFGHGIESLALQCDTAELKRIISQGGTTRLIDINIEAETKSRRVFIREIQKDELSGQLLHVDFYQVKLTEKITAEIPIVLVGEAPATKSKDNIIEQVLNQLEVSCLPDKIPPRIEVGLASLKEAGDAIHVRDVALDPDIAVAADPGQLIVKVSKIKIAVEKEAVAEAAVEEEAAVKPTAEQAKEATAPAEEKAEGQD
jgi:large subunit ribosomal protein L25